MKKAARASRWCSPARILEWLKADGLLVPGALFVALLLGAGGVIVEALLFRGLLELGQTLSFAHRIDAVIALFVFLFGLLLLEGQLASIRPETPSPLRERAGERVVRRSIQNPLSLSLTLSPGGGEGTVFLDEH